MTQIKNPTEQNINTDPNKQNQNNEGLLSRPVVSSSSPTETKADRPKIDFALREINRALPKDQLLALLKTDAPRLWELAQVVGKWVWIQFSDKQPPEVTSVLAQLGFHWNNKRRVWQHPCGPVTADASPDDPRSKYGSFFPADTQPA